MGKSVVLKDLSHRPAGYVVLSAESILCRAQLSAPARLTLLFSDGTARECPMDAHRGEQRFDCTKKEMEKEMCGCYVSAEEELLLYSDEHARCAFEMRLCRKMQNENEKKLPEPEQTDPLVQAGRQEMMTKKESPIPQRRWPQPPCWDGAFYQQGSWRDGTRSEES